MRRWFALLLLLFCTFILSGCHSRDKNVLLIGTIAGPETELMQAVAQVAKNKYGLNVKVIEFTDYIQPNAALNDGSIDMNMFQHQPYLDQQIKNRHYELVSIGKTFIYPMGIYSTKIKTISAVKPGDLIAIPNDPSNEGRALLLLQKAGLIKLNASAGLFATPADIQDNPHQLKFKELDAAQLSRSLPDVTFAAINTNYAVAAGLSPAKDAIYLEGKDSPYANIIVVRTKDANDPRMKQIVSAFQSPEVLQEAKRLFNDQALRAW
jgi:D-methionine transport system substrate-binding protein